MALQYHTKLDVGDIAPYVLLPGDPKRVATVASYWDEAHLVADNREHVTYTGTYKGMPISCTSTGMGCPSTSIALEELAQVGATTFLRIGTCGTFQDFINVGDIIVFDSACRYDGASKAYAPIEYPAAAHYQMINACVAACEDLGYAHHVGATRTADTFFAGHPRPGSSFNNYWHSSWEHYFEDLKRMNVYGAEMEASIIMILSRLWGLRAGGIAVTLDNMLTVSGEDGNFDPETQLDHSQDAIEKLSKAGCEALYQIWLKDQAGK